MSYTRTPERWSIICDGCGFTVEGLSEPSRPADWSNLKHWSRQTLGRDDSICPDCAFAIENVIEAVFEERRSLLHSTKGPDHAE